MKYTIDVIPCRRADNRKKLFLTRYSCPPSDAKKNILFIHGLTFTQHVFDIDYKDYSVMRYFARKGYTVWGLDIGGHGRSQRYKDGFSINTQTAALDTVTAIETIRTEQEVDTVDLIGWSWGTLIVTEAAGQHPDLIRKLGIVGPVTGGTIPALPPEFFPDDKAMIDYDTATRLFRHKLAASGAISDDDDDEIDYDVTEIGVVNQAMHNLVRYDLTEPKPQGPNVELMGIGDTWPMHVENIQAPTLIMKGTDDIYSTDERVDVIMGKLPQGSEKCVIRGGGHGMFYEKDYYIEFREKLLMFLEK